MKKLIRILFISLIFLYILFAFGCWEINPGKWSLDAGVGMCIVVGIVFSAIGAWKFINEDDL